MRRKIETRLAEWARHPQRRPMLLLGARQVGKTYSAEWCGRAYFASTVTVNFQTHLARLTEIYRPDLDPGRILGELESLTRTIIAPGSTLLILDEIQLCQPAITALKYFAEQMPDLAVIATGSLFGVLVHRDPQYSFPVGKVAIAHLYPLDFEEFLWASDLTVWADGVRRAYEASRPFPAHEAITALFRRYLMIGGLPAVVSAWVDTADWAVVREAQAELNALYTADMSIYLGDTDAVRTQSVWASAPRQLARETSNKFKLSEVTSDARRHQFEAPFAWLEAAGLVHRHYQTTRPIAPLEPRDDGTFYKVYLLDVGIVAAALAIDPAAFTSDIGYSHLSPGFRGALAENYVKQTFVAAGLETLYWSSGNTAEVDFLITDSLMRVIPVEVKSGPHVRSKSLNVYRAAYDPPLAIRFSTNEFGDENGIRSIPLYAAFCVDRQVVVDSDVG